MSEKVVRLFDFNSDSWIIPSNDGLVPYNFTFDWLPNEWFKYNIKRTTKECLTIGKKTDGTLNRYNYALLGFFKFLEESTFEVETFADVTPIVVEQFVFWMLVEVSAPSTRAVYLAALKHHIKHGQLFGWEGYPEIDIFDGTEFRSLKTEDNLKSMVISDPILEQIDRALECETHNLEPLKIIVRCLIMIIRYTGMRISEVLSLHEDSLRKDMLGKPLLEVNNEKGQTERYIPVRKEVVKAIETLLVLTVGWRNELGTKLLFVHRGTRDNKLKFLLQKICRDHLEYFIKDSDIRNDRGELVKLTYHQFRHTLGTDMLNNGMSIFEVQEYLGHESLHSTRLYAKVRNDKLVQEYKKLGFIGLIVDHVEKIVDQNGNEVDDVKRLKAVLPDGICNRPINEKVNKCKLPNACLFCKKFITTPEFLDGHKEHLERIRKDKERYMAENFVGTDYLLFETEKVLLEIIEGLEKLITEKGATVNV